MDGLSGLSCTAVFIRTVAVGRGMVADELSPRQPRVHNASWLAGYWLALGLACVTGKKLIAVYLASRRGYRMRAGDLHAHTHRR